MNALPRQLAVALVLAAGFGVWVAQAADFCVDPVVGSDEAGDGSQAAPWLTIQHAFDAIEGTAAEPHTVHLAPGVYSRDTNGETGVYDGAFWLLMAGPYESLLGSGTERTSIEVALVAGEAAGVSSLSCSLISTRAGSPEIERCVMKDGSIGVSCATGSTPSIINTTVWDCSKGLAWNWPTAAPRLRNCIFWGSTIEIEKPEGEPPLDVTYSLVQGGYPGEGNIDADPRWIDPVNGDFRLRWDSPCIDAGDPNDPVPPGGGSRIDMGAFEYQFLPIPAVTGLVFDDAEGGDGDGIPEAGEVVRGRITVTNYGEPASSLQAELVFEDPSSLILDGRADFPDLASGESGQTLGDGFAWRVPGDWPQAGPVEMVLNWTSAEGSGSERCWVTLNGTDVWVAETGDDETGLGTRAAPWRTLRHALVSVHGTHLQPVTVHIEEGTYSISTNGEVFPIRPGPYERLKGEYAVERPAIDSGGSGNWVMQGSEGADLVNLEVTFPGSGEEDGCYYTRFNADIIDSRFDRLGGANYCLRTEKSLFLDRCTSNGSILASDSVIVHSSVLNVQLTGGTLQFCQTPGLVQALGGSRARILDNVFLPDGRASDALYLHGESVARQNTILEDSVSIGAVFEHNYMDGLSFGEGQNPASLYCSGGQVHNNIFISRGIPVHLSDPLPIEFRNNIVLPGMCGIAIGLTYPIVENITVYSTSAATEHAVEYGDPANSIIWTPGVDVFEGNARYCCVEDGVLPGPGNISADPLLIGAGHSTGLTPFSLVDTSADWEPGVLKGLRLNPNLAQHETLLIETNTSDEIFVIGDPRELASAGDAYLVPWMKLEAGSPCIDAGDPNPAYNDPDGSRNDMGAWGGPYAEGHRTPTPSPTSTATPPTTPTPTPEPALGVSLWMPASEFLPGDLCALFVTIENPGPPLSMVPLFVVLEVYGEYWFAPSWSHWPDGGLDGYFVEALPIGAQEIRVIEPFTWPQGAGSAAGLFFHAALTDSEVTTVLGEPASWEFAYGP